MTSWLPCSDTLRRVTDAPTASSLTDFIARLPKAELHVHHVGSASARIVSELAERHPGAVPSDPDALREFFAFRDFAHFIDVYLSVVDLIRTPEDIRYLTYEVAREMAEGQRIRYAELTCTPYTSVMRGIAIEAYTEAIEDARVAAERDFGLVLRWIYDIPGESGVPSADATLAYALDHRVDALVGFGLGGPEIGVAAGAVPAALRRRPGRRAAQRAARRRDHRPGDDLGILAPARRRADRARHLGRPGPGAAGPPRRDRHRPGGLPVVQRRHPRRRLARRAPAARLRGRRGHRDDQLRRPADVRHHPQPGVRRRRRSARPRRGRPRRPRPRGRARVVRRGGPQDAGC